MSMYECLLYLIWHHFRHSTKKKIKLFFTLLFFFFFYQQTTNVSFFSLKSLQKNKYKLYKIKPLHCWMHRILIALIMYRNINSIFFYLILTWYIVFTFYVHFCTNNCTASLLLTVEIHAAFSWSIVVDIELHLSQKPWI